MLKQPEYFATEVTDERRWFLALPKERERALVTVSVGCERCLPDYVVQRQDFGFECVEFVAEGRGVLELHGKQHSLQAGSVFSYGPGLPHRIQNTTKAPMLKYFLDCGGLLAKTRFRECDVGGGKVFQVGDVEEVVELFELLIRNAMSESDMSPRLCASLVETLLLKLAEKRIDGANLDTRALGTYQRIRRYMQENFIELRTMAEVAKGTGVDPAYLSRVFRRFHRMSPYRFLMRLKMSHAASLLLKADRLIKEVAHEMGFGDPFHFSRSFKSVYGVSPEHFLRGKSK